MNLPNLLTLSRIFFVPILLAVLLRKEAMELDAGWMVLTREMLALGIFLTASITDLLDGYIARKRRQITTFGKLVDPTADKVLVAAVLISLVELDRVPAWMVVLIVSREFAVSALRYLALTQGITIVASDYGKAKMVAQVIAVSLLLMAPYSRLVEQLGNIAMWLALLVTIWSMIDYFWCFWNRTEEGIPDSGETDKRIVIRKKLTGTRNSS